MPNTTKEAVFSTYVPPESTGTMWRTKRELMSRFRSKNELVDDAAKALTRLEDLLASIPEESELAEVTDGMSVKDFLAHRTEWGRMMIRWYTEARDGQTPAVPSEKYKWNQLNDLNAEIHDRFADISLLDAHAEFGSVNRTLFELIDGCSEEELFSQGVYSFTGKSDLATYFSSSTGGNYRSAFKHINKWWRAEQRRYLA